jgi:hypothetical protein
VRYVTAFDRPNLRSAWQESSWTHAEIVDHFLDFYLPFAKATQDAGMLPIFSPLEPGGDYWDTVFLQSALRSIEKRGYAAILDDLVLGAYAWLRGRPLDWGAGGPEHWPLTYPYATPDGSQDQRGFHIFDWYRHITEAEIGKSLPIILMRVGSHPTSISNEKSADTDLQHAADMASIARSLLQSAIESPVDDCVIASNFWLLSAESGSPYANQAWFKPDGTNIPAVTALRHLAAGNQMVEVRNKNAENQNLTINEDTHQDQAKANSQPIPHYLLVPLYAWGVAEWDLNSIRPVIERFHPTVGFSVEEARLASRVTIVGSTKAFTDVEMQSLREAGCQLEILDTNGNIIAI